jgi:hypothetical protein
MNHLLELPLVLAAVAEIRVEVWGDVCMAWPMGETAAQWLSDALGIDCQFGLYAREHAPTR